MLINFYPLKVSNPRLRLGTKGSNPAVANQQKRRTAQSIGRETPGGLEGNLRDPSGIVMHTPFSQVYVVLTENPYFSAIYC